jgi:folate-binding protein YgfZ
LFDFLVWADGEDLLIDCEDAQVDALIRRLAMYRLRRRIAIERDDSLAVHWSPTGDDGVPDPRLPALGRRWIGPADGAAQGWRAHRLGLGVTEGVAELGSDKTLWLEANAAELNGVSFSKGCYVGQENTARMNWRQKVNRRLAVLRAAQDPGETANVYYADLGLAVLRLPADRLATGSEPVEGAALVRPDWLMAALTQSVQM